MDHGKTKLMTYAEYLFLQSLMLLSYKQKKNFNHGKKLKIVIIATKNPQKKICICSSKQIIAFYYKNQLFHDLVLQNSKIIPKACN